MLTTSKEQKLISQFIDSDNYSKYSFSQILKTFFDAFFISSVNERNEIDEWRYEAARCIIVVLCVLHIYFTRLPKNAKSALHYQFLMYECIQKSTTGALIAVKWERNMLLQCCLCCKRILSMALSFHWIFNFKQIQKEFYG